MKKKKTKIQMPKLQAFLNKVTAEKLAQLRATENDNEIDALLAEANEFLTNYLTANEEEKINQIIKQLKEIKLSENLEFEDEMLEFDINQNYYEILEINENSTQEEVKKACKKLSLKYHPDKNPGNHQAEEKFKEIQKAAEILLSDSTKKYYDALRKVNNYSETTYSNFTYEQTHNWEETWGENSWKWDEGEGNWSNENHTSYELLEIKKANIVQDIWRQLAILPEVYASELDDVFLGSYESFTDKIDSLETEEEIDLLHLKILKEIEIKRKSKRKLLATKANSIKKIENALIKENQIELEDLDRNEYSRLFAAFGNNHNCLLLANYKWHINNCLTKIKDIQDFEKKLLELIEKEEKKLEKFKKDAIKEIKQEVFPFKLEEEMEGFETSSWSNWEQKIHDGKNMSDVNEYKNKFLQFISRKLTRKLLEKVKNEALQEVKEALNPQGQLAVQVNELDGMSNNARICSCFSYQTYKDHINEHLEKISQITIFKEQIIVAINNKREEKRNSRNQRKKARNQLDKILEKVAVNEINKFERVEEINPLVEKANSLLANEIYTKEERREIQAVIKNLETKKEELKQEGNKQREKDQLIIRLQAELEKVNNKNKMLGEKIESLEKENEAAKSAIEHLNQTAQKAINHLKGTNEKLQLELNQEKNRLESKQKELEAERNENIAIKQQLMSKEDNSLKNKFSEQEKLVKEFLQNQKNETARLEEKLTNLQISEQQAQILQTNSSLPNKQN